MGGASEGCLVWVLIESLESPNQCGRVLLTPKLSRCRQVFVCVTMQCLHLLASGHLLTRFWGVGLGIVCSLPPTGKVGVILKSSPRKSALSVPKSNRQSLSQYRVSRVGSFPTSHPLGGVLRWPCQHLTPEPGQTCVMDILKCG